jgi:hypothetical protein
VATRKSRSHAAFLLATEGKKKHHSRSTIRAFWSLPDDQPSFDLVRLTNFDTCFFPCSFSFRPPFTASWVPAILGPTPSTRNFRIFPWRLCSRLAAPGFDNWHTPTIRFCFGPGWPLPQSRVGCAGNRQHPSSLNTPPTRTLAPQHPTITTTTHAQTAPHRGVNAPNTQTGATSQGDGRDTDSCLIITTHYPRSPPQLAGFFAERRRHASGPHSPGHGSVSHFVPFTTLDACHFSLCIRIDCILILHPLSSNPHRSFWFALRDTTPHSIQQKLVRSQNRALVAFTRTSPSSSHRT